MKKLAAFAAGIALAVGIGAYAAKPPNKEAVQLDQPTKQEQNAVAKLYGSTPYIVETIQVNGEIDDGTTVAIKNAVEQINANPRVKAVVLELSSPGGSSSASEASYEELSKVRVPVVAWCDGMCASGAYYIAMSPAVKYLGAREESITGCVGVIMHEVNYGRLLDKLKIDNEVYASGSLKDAGDPATTPSAEQQKYLQSIVDQLAQRFYAVVAKARPGIKDWTAVKTGKVFIGEDAVKRGIIDGLMDEAGAIRLAKKLSGEKVIFTREEMKKIGALADEPSAGVDARNIEPRSKLFSWESDLHTLVSMIAEVKGGRKVEFKYIMPMRF